MKLWLIRHATPCVAAGVCYGGTDLPVDARANQAAALALAAELPAAIALRTSMLQRCELLTQSLFGLRADLAPKTDVRLAEMDFGRWEGVSWDAIGAQAIAAWTQDFAQHRPGGGESVQNFMARVAGVFDEVRAQGRDCAWVTHAGVIRAANLLARGTRGIDNAADWPIAVVGYGCWQVLDL